MRLSHHLAIVFSLFGLAIAGGFQYQHLRALRRESYALAQNRAETTAGAIRALVEEDARSGSLARLGRHLEDMVRITGVATIVVRDARGRRLIGRSDDVRWTSRDPHPDVPIDKVGDGLYDVEKQVDLGPRGKGVVQLGFHTDPLESRLREIGGQAVRSGVMAFLAITILAWLIGVWFGLKLERLVPRIEALPRDPLNFRPIRVDGFSDEFARLATAFNNLGASLKAETRRRRDLEREKQELAAMLVHDLKTPLTVIRSGITLLQEQMADAPVGKNGRKAGGTQRTFELLEMSTKRLHRMVEDVLQLARMEEVAGLRERVHVDLSAMATACAKDFDLIATERGQKLAVKTPRKGAAVEVFGDPTLLRRVLDNLVSNAVEHTPSGGSISIEVRPDHGHARVSVSDTGQGVPEEARADLFRKFFQKDVKRHVGNVGLGLAFCEKAVLRHDGAIGIEDAKPRGACFYFMLPLAAPHLPLAHEPQAERPFEPT